MLLIILCQEERGRYRNKLVLSVVDSPYSCNSPDWTQTLGTWNPIHATYVSHRKWSNALAALSSGYALAGNWNVELYNSGGPIWHLGVFKRSQG